MQGFNAGLLEQSTASPVRRSDFTVSNDIGTAAAGCTNGNLLPLFTTASGDVATNGGNVEQVYVYGGTGPSWNLVVIAEVPADASEVDQQLVDQIVANVHG